MAQPAKVATMHAGIPLRLDPPDAVTRSWAQFKVRRLSDDKREIEGVATTPETDRLGDIVEPLGISFKNPLPLLWQHHHDAPVGLVRMHKPTEDGVTFTAQLARVEEPGRLKDRIDEAWQSIKAGIVRGVSIGFRPIEWNFMDEGGVRFVESEIVEVSLVTVPANSGATINEIRSIDAASLAVSGRSSDARELPAVVGHPSKPTRERSTKMPQTIAEQISAFEARRKAADARMIEMMQTRSEAGETLDDAEGDEYNGLQAEVKKIDEHIARLVDLETRMRNAAVPVAGNTIDEQSQTRSIAIREFMPQPEPEVIPPPKAIALRSTALSNGVIRVRSNAPPTAGFIRLCLAMMAGKGNRADAYAYAKKRLDWHSSTPEILSILADDDVMYHLRAAVPAGTTYDSTWAGPLVYAQNLTSAFAEFLRPLTIIGRFNTLRRVPFNIRVPRVTGGTSGSWVGEAAPKPVTSMTLDTITMPWAKAAAIVVLTEELVRFSNPAAEDMVRSDLSRSITQFLDRQFVDPSVAVVTGVSPASITNGITPITPTGTNMAAFRADVKTLMNQLLVANQSLAGGYWIMTQQQAMSLSIAQNSLGQTIYPSINPEQGGTLLGYPVIASENIPATGGSPADGYPLIFAIGPEILLADDGAVTIDASREASLQMDSAPDSPPSASTNMLSLWQLNMLGLRAERYITWQRRRSTAVAWIQNAKYAE